ncbi:MAG: hypothetical protein ACTSRP_19740 [Candidatus Helarchaeota archaeon]
MKNLDQLCAEYGFKFASNVSEALRNKPKSVTALFTDALGVLQEQGLYAFALFCESRDDAKENDKKSGSGIIKNLAGKLLKELNLIENEDILEELRKKVGLASKLDDLMLAIQVLEKSLIYARFHAKAMEKS